MLYYISIQIPCLPSDDSMTIKMETLSSSCQIVTRACHTIVTYLGLLAARQARANDITLLTHYVSHHDANNTIKTNNYNAARWHLTAYCHLVASRCHNVCTTHVYLWHAGRQLWCSWPRLSKVRWSTYATQRRQRLRQASSETCFALSFLRFSHRFSEETASCT